MRLRFTPLVLLSCVFSAAAATSSFTLEQVLSAPFPTALTASPSGGAVAWVLDERGARNLWAATAPEYVAHRLTSFLSDDGQEIAQLSWAPDGKSLAFVRGGDFEMHRDNPNPASLAAGVEQAIWLTPLNGGPPRKVALGSQPAISPRGDRMVYLSSGALWSIDLTPDAKPAQIIHTKGRPSDLAWSPDGARLAYSIDRGDHSFIAVYDLRSQTIKYLDASTDKDSEPVWSPDSKQIAFIRIPASTRAFSFGPVRTAQPWSIRIADVETGAGRELWCAHEGMGSVFSAIVSDHQLFWTSGDKLVFPWEKTGWRHLYAVSARGGTAAALTGPGEFEVEHVSLSQDKNSIFYSSNENDIDRRHLWRVSVGGGRPEELTPGKGIEWSPVDAGQNTVVFLHSDATHPARPAIRSAAHQVRELAPESFPSDFPAAALIAPQPVIIAAADGMPIHAQLFLPAGSQTQQKRPALIFFHGGSRRQMLLGFHYMDYYHNAYAMNQYLASLGYVVLVVNYRSGIGYGLNFREALNYGATGASEFNDVLGAGLYLRSRPDVDPQRIGLWGGSYGGYLTALGLSRASDLFSVGVDFHGVHNWSDVIRNFVSAYDPSKSADVARVAFESSPMSSLATWRSPVLLIHGDDDRNVPFQQTLILAEALRQHHVAFEELIFPDEIHGFLTHKRWLEAYSASANFLGRHLKP